MNKEEIKFDLNEDIFLQIAMMSYAKHNDKLCSINEHLGEIYSYKDLVDAEELQEHYEKHLGEIAIKQLQQENKQLKEQLDVHKILLQTNAPSTCILTELEEWLKEKWYEIEPKGTGINFNCEYDSEEDYVRGMETKSKLDTLKNSLNKIQKLKEKYK